MADSTNILMEQLPDYFRPILEFQEILKAQGLMLDELDDLIGQVYANLYISTCDEMTIAVYERLFGMTYQPGNSLEYRREWVLQKFNRIVPFTLQFLKSKLEDLFGDAYDLLIDPSACTISVKVTSDRYRAMDLLHDLLWDILPAHLAVSASQEVTNYATAEMYVSGFLSGVCIQTVPPELSYHIQGEIPVAVFTSNTIIQSIGG